MSNPKAPSTLRRKYGASFRVPTTLGGTPLRRVLSVPGTTRLFPSPCSAFFLLPLLFCAFFMLSLGARGDEVLVSAAASLTDAFNEIGKAYTKGNPQTTVRFNFGASGALQQQIAQGAPVDVFASASPKEMDALQAAGRLAKATRADFAGNRLVLIAPLHSGLKTWEDLRGASVKRIALSNPASVPSGRYAQETLTHRGLWNAIQPKLVFGENVRQTLAYVTNGDVDAGVVFATAAQVEKTRVRVVQTALPVQDHQPILYPVAAIADAPNPAGARRFVVFLQSPTARSILARYGFAPAHPTPVKSPVKPSSSPHVLQAPQHARRG